MQAHRPIHNDYLTPPSSNRRLPNRLNLPGGGQDDQVPDTPTRQPIQRPSNAARDPNTPSFDSSPFRPAHPTQRSGIAITLQANRPLFFPPRGTIRFKRRRMTADQVVNSALNKPAIKRLARRGGVRRIKSDIYAAAQDAVKTHVREVLRISYELIRSHTLLPGDADRRKTITTRDIIYALRVLGKPIYGCGIIVRGEDVHSRAAYMREKRRGQRVVAEEEERRAGEERERGKREERVGRLLEGMRRGAR